MLASANKEELYHRHRLVSTLKRAAYLYERRDEPRLQELVEDVNRYRYATAFRLSDMDLNNSPYPQFSADQKRELRTAFELQLKHAYLAFRSAGIMHDHLLASMRPREKIEHHP
jgi:hypothetical protein